MTIDIICFYGCGQIATVLNKSGRWMCSSSSNKCPANKEKNSQRLKKAYESGKRVSGKELYESMSEVSKSRMVWSKGLTKETHPSINNMAMIQSKTKMGKPGTAHTEKSKRLLSEKRIAFLERTNKRCNWFDVAGVKVQGSLEKRFAEFLLDAGILFERKRLTYKNFRKYTPDFYIPKFDMYVEVKGFLYEKDKEKIRMVLEENDVDLRMIFKRQILEISTVDEILKLPKATEYIKDIDYSKFTNFWGR